MAFQRFSDDEIRFMIYGWHKKHRVRITQRQLHAIITHVRERTLEERRRLKREEMRRYRAKQRQQTTWIAEMREAVNVEN